MESIIKPRTSYGAPDFVHASDILVESQSSKSKLWCPAASHICFYSQVKRESLLRATAIRGFLQLSDHARYMNVRTRGKIGFNAAFNSGDVSNIWRFARNMRAGGGHGNPHRSASNCAEQIWLEYSLPRNVGVMSHLGTHNLLSPSFGMVGDGRLGQKRRSVTRCSYIADRNCLEAGYADTCDLENRPSPYEKLLKEFCAINVTLGRIVLFLFGSTVLFFLSGAALSKVALAQQSNIATPTPQLDISQTPATSTEDSSMLKDKQDVPEQSITDETSNSTVASEGSAPSVDTDSEPKDKQAFLEEFVERYPRDLAAHKALLRLYINKGQLNDGARVLDKLLILEPDNINWRYLRAQAYDFSGDVKAARKAFEELYQLQPLSARILQGLALSMQQMGENPVAIIEMLKNSVNKALLEKKTKEARNVRMLLGQILTLQGNLIEALKQYKQMEEEDSRDFRPYLCQGLLYSIVGDTEEAENYFRRYRELCPSDFPNRSYLDDLMLEAKSAAQKLQEQQKKEESGSTNLRSNKQMKQPNINNEWPTGNL